MQLDVELLGDDGAVIGSSDDGGFIPWVLVLAERGKAVSYYTFVLRPAPNWVSLPSDVVMSDVAPEWVALPNDEENFHYEGAIEVFEEYTSEENLLSLVGYIVGYIKKFQPAAQA